MPEIHTFHMPYLNIYVKSYLIMTDHYNVFIDSGLQSNMPNIRQYLQNGKQNVLLMTHGHWDHIGLNADIRQYGGVIYAHFSDMRFFQDFNWHWQVGFEQYANDMTIPPERSEVFWREIGQPAVIDYSVQDGMELKFDDLTLYVIGLPGHTNGSVGYYVPSDKTLFTGDALMECGFFGGLAQYCDYEAYISSMQKIMELAPEVIFTSHTNPYKKGTGTQAAKEAVDFAGRVKKRVEDYLKSTKGCIVLKDAAHAVCESERRSMGGGACVSVLNHLCDMRAEDSRIEDCVEKYICGF